MSLAQLVLENVYVVRKMSDDEELERVRTIPGKPNPISWEHACHPVRGVYCYTSGAPISEFYALDLMQYVPSDKTPKVSAKLISEVTEQVQPSVAASLDRSLKEHADVWAELSKY
jgi:hypothetical protein